MSDEPYPDRKAVLKSIIRAETNTTILKNFVESYIELRDKRGPKDAMAVEFSTSSLIPKESELDVNLHELAAHLPKMLAAGDQAQELVEKAMKANDDAASFMRELKEKLCPELWGGDGVAASAQLQAVTLSATATGTIHIKTMTGKIVSIQADPSDTVATVKLRYQDLEGTPPDQQRLIKAGKELNDETTLAESDVNSNDTLHLVLKLRQAPAGGADGDKNGGGCCSVQ